MGKNFWPLFIIVAALGAAAVWTQTPRHVTKLPDGLRRTFRSYVRSAQGLSDITEQIAAQTDEKDKPVTLLGGGTASAVADAPGKPEKPEKADIQVKPDVPASPAAPVPTVPRFAAPADIKGIKVVDVASAEWCVLMRSTPIEALDEKPLGNASGGRFFLIERRARAANGKLLIGNFTPKKLSQPVQINSRYALCLSGSPDELSTAQRHALKMYYQLRGEALDYLEEIRQTNGDSASPFYHKLLEAERIRDFRAKELSQMNSLRSDQRAVEVSELEKLKTKAADIRAQHEEWKRAHSTQIADPKQDPHYKELVTEYRRYATSLPAGLAIE